jgi:hypothetical protein
MVCGGGEFQCVHSTPVRRDPDDNTATSDVLRAIPQACAKIAYSSLSAKSDALSDDSSRRPQHLCNLVMPLVDCIVQCGQPLSFLGDVGVVLQEQGHCVLIAHHCCHEQGRSIVLVDRVDAGPLA